MIHKEQQMNIVQKYIICLLCVAYSTFCIAEWKNLKRKRKQKKEQC